MHPELLLLALFSLFAPTSPAFLSAARMSALHLPPVNLPVVISQHAHRFVAGSFVLSGALVTSFVVYWIVFRLLLRKKVSPHHHQTLRRFRKPIFSLFIIAAFTSALPTFGVSSSLYGILAHVLHILFILALTWVLFVCVYAVEDVLVHRYDINETDNLQARRVRTQMAVMRRLAFLFIGVLALGAVLYTFHGSKVWKAGAGLLASAGLATLVLASAAKSTVSNLLAGIQIALTEPIRLDDVVIVDNEWGRIEEITTAYVVVRIWDLRRLIVPLSYFIEHPFQNWTRTSANLLGTVFLYADYTCPTEPLRAELSRLLKSTPKWDGKVDVLQVTDLSEQTKQIRALMSANSSGDLFDLRCFVRENLVDFLQKNFPEHLPKHRNELQKAPWEESSLDGSGDRRPQLLQQHD